MKALIKITSVISKIMEILCWICAVIMVIVAVLSVVAKDYFIKFINDMMPVIEEELSSFDLSMLPASVDGNNMVLAVTIFSISAVLIIALLALIFHSFCSIFKTSEEAIATKTGSYPLRKKIAGILKRIGILYIFIAIVELTGSIVAKAMIDPEIIGLEISPEELIIGILFICIGQIFSLRDIPEPESLQDPPQYYDIDRDDAAIKDNEAIKDNTAV